MMTLMILIFVDIIHIYRYYPYRETGQTLHKF